MSTSDAASTRSEPPEQALLQAKADISGARFGAAIAALQAILDGDCSREVRTEALYMLAVATRYSGAPEPALRVLETLLAESPDYARGWQEQGHALLALGRPAAAVQAFNAAVQRNPALTASWKALAALHERGGEQALAAIALEQARFLEALPPELVSVSSFIHEDKLGRAEEIVRHFLQHNRQHVEAMRLLADIGVRMKIYDDAEFLLESCVAFEPDNVRARIDYLHLLIRKTRFQQAHEQAGILLAKDPDSPVFQSAMAAACIGLGRVDEGIEWYRRVLQRFPANHEAHVSIGHALKTIGRTAEAIAAYQAAYQLRGDHGDAYWSLANTKTYRFSDAEIERIRQAESDPATATEDRIHLCFAAGKALEDRAEYDAAFGFYERGNSLKRHALCYSPQENEQRVQRQMTVCTPALFERHAGSGCPRPDPIFIVGLPRAGSTLLEQILASHSMVDGTMELHDILALAQRLRGRSTAGESRYPAILQELEPEYFRRFGEQYLDNTQVYRQGAPRFIDKMPNNFLHIGLIRLILPNARIIDARRDPMACCFSGFKQLFGEGQEFSYGLEAIGRYYKGYVQLMDHWDAVLPGFVLRVMHEDVVEDLEGQVRRILAFCGLPFEDNCLRFHETERSVRTPSSEQVRRPIYRSGLDQWRHFEAHLEPLKVALGPEILARYASGR